MVHQNPLEQVEGKVIQQYIQHIERVVLIAH